MKSLLAELNMRYFNSANGLIYIEKKDKQYEIAVADPLYKEQSLQLSMNGEQINIVFPSGDYSGSSVIKHITEKH